ncbi:MAG: glycoside hydrolase [Gammaproteobacteria bacterium]|nr:glycoside hydrolase [Gammaproteobacteria bacterium]
MRVVASAAVIGAGLLFALATAAGAAPPSGTATVGLGAYYTELKGGMLGSAPRPPAAEYRSGEAVGKAAPTNQWYSSVMFQRWSQPLHAHPMTYRAVEAGFELGLPTRRLAVENGGAKRELSYLHAAAVTVSPVAFKPQDARLAKFSDWLVQVSMAAGAGESLTATVLHGSPFSYYECSKGDVRFRLASQPKLLSDPKDASRDARVASFTVDGKAYAVFAPTGSSWEWTQPTELVLHLPAGARYFSVAGLPNDSEATLRDFLAVAYAFPTDTRVDWAYDEKTSAVRTTFRVETVAKEGQNLTTLMGLYPHQWNAAKPVPASTYQYESVRGPIRLVAGNGFSIERTYRGTLPSWSGLQDPANAASVNSLLVGDVVKANQLFTKMGRGTYWYGKGLGAVAQLMSIAEAQGQPGKRDELLKLLKARFETWFDGRHDQYFMQDSSLGTFVGYPQEYDSVTAMNDHHFHYGYWVMGAAHVALRDPAWASKDKWGGMVDKIVADIATDERGRADFPFLRNYDPYEGHSWASGNADFDAGNNQESSSEAVNAWAGLILWGEATGNRKVRDLGIYLYTSEVASVQQYWFDLNRQVLDREFGKPFASMVFGGKYAYNTWWTQEPRQIMGINLLPFTPASTYLAEDTAYIRKLMDGLPADVKTYQANVASDGTPADVWQDVLASYLALADGDAGLAYWSKRGSVEFGETRTRTLYWLHSLREMGSPDLSVTADTPLYSVFRDKAGSRTYLAYNARDTAIRVTFSTGKVLDVAPRSLARAR